MNLMRKLCWRAAISIAARPSPSPSPSPSSSASASAAALLHTSPCPGPVSPHLHHHHHHGGRATIIDGRSVADVIKQEVKKEVELLKSQVDKAPGLAVIVAGCQRSSMLYVENKTIACDEVGITSMCEKLPENVSEDQILATIRKHNEDPSTHGILVQLPLPKHLDEERILGAIKLEKDVDGCHPLNIASLVLREKEPLFVPCTAKACLRLLLDRGVPLSGKYAVVIGCSNIAGLPISLLLQNHNATVTRVHLLTKNPEKYTRNADIVISAAGCPNLIRGDWLKPNAVVLDVGINHIPCPESGDYQLVGDVCMDEACTVASLISPVPGGVGPVTIAMLLQNTVLAAKMSYAL